MHGGRARLVTGALTALLNFLWYKTRRGVTRSDGGVEQLDIDCVLELRVALQVWHSQCDPVLLAMASVVFFERVFDKKVGPALVL